MKEQHVQPVSEILFGSESLYIGRFRCRPADELWRRENCAGDWPTVVFPRTAVGIRQSARHPVVATANQTMLYNPGQRYGRTLIDPRGDCCEFFGVRPQWLVDISESLRQPILDRDQPFAEPCAPCPPRTYLAQRSLFQTVAARKPDPMWVEETFLGVMEEVVLGQMRLACHRQGRTRVDSGKHREQVEAAKEFMACHFRRSLQLADVADAVDVSVFHLCRIFKRHTGESVHGFLTQLRLRSALERLQGDVTSLTQLALELNFSSHSHFTNVFRRHFGLPPARWRSRPWLEERDPSVGGE